jgi:hypothetical protein
MTGSIYPVPRDRYCGDKVEIPGRRKSSFDTKQTFIICFRKRKCGKRQEHIQYISGNFYSLQIA